MSKRWTEDDLKKLRPGAVAEAAKPAKYRNRKTEVDGIEFDSKKEGGRWQQLQIMLRAGKIKNLRRQVRYGLTVNGELVCSYVADFTYRNGAGDLVVEDVKSETTRKLPVYQIKRKLMLAVHGIEIKEV